MYKRQVGGAKDLAQHLSGLTMRLAVVSRLIDILRSSGYPGYEFDGVNSITKVKERLKDSSLMESILP